MALKYNAKYVKAMERRARVIRKQAEKRQKESDDLSIEEREEIVKKLKTALEDCTSVCILEGFQKQEPMILVDQILKDLGRAEARLASKKRVPVLSSENFIRQYFQSFSSDPIMNHENVQMNGDSEANES